jgi:hypothetical protein
MKAYSVSEIIEEAEVYNDLGVYTFEDLKEMTEEFSNGKIFLSDDEIFAIREALAAEDGKSLIWILLNNDIIVFDSYCPQELRDNIVISEFEIKD